MIDYSEAPPVSIVLVNWNGKNLLKAHLPGLQRLDYPNYEVIVVDNASTDGSVEFVKNRYPEFKVIVNEENLGTAEGSNVAIPYCRGKYIFWVSNDMEFDTRILNHLIKCCEADESIGICTVKMRCFREGRPVNELDSVGANMDIFAFPVPRGINQIDRGQYDKPAEVFFSFGGAMFIRRSVLDIVGGFDPEYLTLTDDIDLSWRVRLAGYKVVVEPKAFLYHRMSATLGKTHNRPQKRYLSERNTLRTLLKNYSTGYLFFILPAYFVILLLEMLFYTCMGKWKMIRACWRAIYWNLNRLAKTQRMRKVIQSYRIVPDSKIMSLMLKRSEKIRIFFDFLRHRKTKRWRSYF